MSLATAAIAAILVDRLATILSSSYGAKLPSGGISKRIDKAVGTGALRIAVIVVALVAAAAVVVVSSISLYRY